MTADTAPFNALERDIDLMLLEELHCSPAFVAWLADQAGVSQAALVSARHSVYDGNGETDVFALIDCPEGRVALMIEDKVGASMQPRQAERYHERGAILCARGTAAKYRTILCAPRNYLAGIQSGDWHAAVSFEDIAEWYGKQSDRRSSWRRETLMRAVKRQERSSGGTSSSQPTIADEVLVRFKNEYCQYVKRVHPEFELTFQRGRDKEYYLKVKGFPKHMRFKHSFSASTMVLVCENKWKTPALAILPGCVPETIRITPHPRTVHVEIGVEPIDLTQSLEDQTDLVDAAMEAARRLLPYAVMVQEEEQRGR